jgi:hypothetical protein
MLERLDEVDWSSLQHAYGAANDVPALLRALLSSSKKERDAAWSKLWGNVIHQGTVWEATPHVVPFLFELLGGPEPDRVLRYLCALAEGEGDDGDGPEDEYPELAMHRGAPQRTRLALARGLDAVRPFLHAPDPACRAEAARFLSILDATALAALAEQHAAETDDVARASILWSARAAGDRTTIPSQIDSPSAIERFVEALFAIASPDVTPRALEIVAEALADPCSVPGYEDLPQRFARIELDTAAMIHRCAPSAVEPLLPVLLQTMHRVSAESPFVGSSMFAAILHIVFEPREAPRIDRKQRLRSSLSARQREVLRELVRDAAIWGEPGRLNGNLGALLNPRGLPTTREAMRDFLGPTD